MKAFYKRPGQQPGFEEVPTPTAKTGEVTLQPLVVGICRTDIYVASELIWRPNPLILGHEFCARVVESNSEKWSEGDRVVVDPLWGKEFMGLHFDGALAERIVVPENKVYSAGTKLSNHLAAYAEPVAAALATSKLALSGKGAIYGKNRIADLSALVLRSRGIIVPILNENAPIPEEEYDYIIETILRPGDGKKLCWGLKPGGTLILKSRKADEVSFPINAIVLKDINFNGVSYGSWDTVIPWIEHNHLDMEELIGKTYPFEESLEAFAYAQLSENQKTFITCAE